MTLVIKSHLSDFSVRVTFSLLSDSGKIKSLRELLTRYKNQHNANGVKTRVLQGGYVNLLI